MMVQEQTVYISCHLCSPAITQTASSPPHGMRLLQSNQPTTNRSSLLAKNLSSAINWNTSNYPFSFSSEGNNALKK